MSRIGNLPILIPGSVEVLKTGKHLVIKGNKGSLEIDINPNIEVVIENKQILVKRKGDLGKIKSMHGLTRSLIFNMIVGVSEGWVKKLELVGVGYRAEANGEKIVLSVGFSHPVEVVAPSGVSFEVSDNTKITVSGINKELVGQVAANIRKIKPPEPYKGKGIKYVGEHIKRKPGKAGKAGAGAGTK